MTAHRIRTVVEQERDQFDYEERQDYIIGPILDPIDPYQLAIEIADEGERKQRLVRSLLKIGG